MIYFAGPIELSATDNLLILSYLAIPIFIIIQSIRAIRLLIKDIELSALDQIIKVLLPLLLLLALLGMWSLGLIHDYVDFTEHILWKFIISLLIASVIGNFLLLFRKVIKH